MKNYRLKILVRQIITAASFMILNAPAIAANSETKLPFASSMKTLQEAISGPFLMSASIIMIVTTCLMLAFGEWGDGFKKIINIVLWLSVAFGGIGFIQHTFGQGATF